MRILSGITQDMGDVLKLQIKEVIVTSACAGTQAMQACLQQAGSSEGASLQAARVFKDAGSVLQAAGDYRGQQHVTNKRWG